MSNNITKYILRFYPFIGFTLDEIVENLKIKINFNSKNLCYKITQEILGDAFVKELKKEGVVVKTVRLKTNLIPVEAISFPTFQFIEFLNTDWIDSDIYKLLNKKYLFIFYSQENKIIKLNCVKEWNIQQQDLILAHKTWLEVREIIIKGKIVKEIKRGKRITYFPKASKKGILHVRPHARDINDTYPLPTIDKKTNLMSYTKHSFWLNKDFIKENILLNG
jgi:DNA mismatch repair protein MutH